MIREKTWPLGDGAYFPYKAIENILKIFVGNHWTDFNITLQNCSFGDPLSKFSSNRHDAWKNMATGEQGYNKIYTNILEHLAETSVVSMQSCLLRWAI